MKTENLTLKFDDPIIGENRLGTIAGYYRETINDHGGIRIRFTMHKKRTNVAHYSRSIDNIRKATEEEVKKLI